MSRRHWSFLIWTDISVFFHFLFFIFIFHLCIYVVFVRLSMFLLAHMLLCVWISKVDVRNCPHCFSTSFFEARSLSWIQNLLIWGVSLNSLPWGASVSTFPGWSYRQFTTPTWYLHGFLGIQSVVLMLVQETPTTESCLQPFPAQLFCIS